MDLLPQPVKNVGHKTFGKSCKERKHEHLERGVYARSAKDFPIVMLFSGISLKEFGAVKIRVIGLDASKVKMRIETALEI